MVTWPSHDNHATTCHQHHLVGRPPSQQTWDLRVPTLFLSNQFPADCIIIILCLLHSGPMHTCSHFRLRGRLYVPLFPVCIPISSTPMQTAALQWLKKLSQCFTVLARSTWHKPSILPNILKIIYVISRHLGFLTNPGSCDLDKN